MWRVESVTPVDRDRNEDERALTRRYTRKKQQEKCKGALKEKSEF